jgi:hypothetical protein
MKFKRELTAGLKSAFEDRRKTFSTVLVSGLFFILLALSTAINYSSQMFSAGIEYWIPAIQFTIKGFYLNGGWTDIILNIIYSILVGVTITNTYTQFRASGLEIGNLSGIAPGMLVAGCAGCGVGLLSLIGMTGKIAYMPFQGLGLKIAGMMLILYFIARIGNPKICSIPSL